jgi:hypothetical protein
VLQVTFVGTGPFQRLPEVLAGPGVRITVVGGRRNPLRRSQFVDEFVEFVELDDGADGIAGALLARPDVIESLRGWIVFGDDTTMFRLATSDLPMSEKLRILPVRKAAGLTMLGSKVGLELVLREAGVAGPRTAIAGTRDEVASAVGQLADVPRLLVKGAEGAAGERVRWWRNDADQIPDAWFPIVVQEFVSGPTVSVEALFRNGELVGWLYSRMTSDIVGGGPSTARCYLSTPSRDFVDDLGLVAKTAGLHGFANCSMVWSPAEGRHRLFEVDVRPNAWAQFGPALGVDWARQMTDMMPGCAEPRIAPDERVAVHLYPRELIDVLEHGRWSGLRPWLLALPGTWGTRNARDRGVNAVDRADLWGQARHAAFLGALIGASRTRQALLPARRRRQPPQVATSRTGA